MLQIIRHIHQLDILQLKNVYRQTLEETEGKMGAYGGEDALVSSLLDFFSVPDAICAVWIHGGHYCAALRLEPYRDGWLISWLETALQLRNRGIGYSLVCGVLSWCAACGRVPVYAHVAKNNAPSLAVFTRCGFVRVKETAAFLDGSVYSSHCTLKFDLINENIAPSH